MFDNEENKYVRLESKIYIDYIKHLGVVIDQNLSWKLYNDSIVTKTSKNVGLIAKLRHSVPRPILLNIFKSLIHAYLTYGLAAWGQACKTNLASNNLFFIESVPTLSTISIMIKPQQHYFRKPLIFNHTMHDRLRVESHFYVKNSRLEIQNNSFSRLGVKLWNKIPSYTADLPKKGFKRFSLNCYLISLKRKMTIFKSHAWLFKKQVHRYTC